MQKPVQSFIYSLADQAFVSAGNFLTIALGARFLPLDEQGKLVSLYAIYVALVLFNIASFFSSANLLNHRFNSEGCYQHLLLTCQFACALVLGLLIAATIGVWGGQQGWNLTALELVLIVLVLFVQQIADHLRRAGYVFHRIRQSAMSSGWMYGVRLILLLYYQPKNLENFLLLMLLPALPVVFYEIFQCYRARSGACTTALQRDMLQQHFKASQWSILNMPLRWAGLHLPLILVGTMHSLQAAAILGSIRAIANFANVLLEMMETLAPAWLATASMAGADYARKKTIRLLAIGIGLWSLGLLAIWGGGREFIFLLLGDRYEQFISILYLVWISNGLFFVYRVVGLHYRTKEIPVMEFVGSLIGAIALLTTIPVIVAYGATGGAIAFLVIQIAALLGMQAYRSWRYARA